MTATSPPEPYTGWPSVARASTGPIRAERSAALLAGGIAAAVALAAGHFAGGLTRTAASPVVAVGERVIKAVPTSVEQFAIRNFGSNDKLALVIGISVISIALGAAAGLLARRRFGGAAIGFVLFGVIGFYASTNPRRGLLTAAFPSMVAVIAGLLALRRLLGLAPRLASRSRLTAETDADLADGAAITGDGADVVPDPANFPTERPKPAFGSRRAFLGAAGLGLVGAVALRSAGTALRNRFSIDASRAAVRLPSPLEPSTPIPPTTILGVDGISPFTTPLNSFYRVDTALVVPVVPAESWSLSLKGMVDQPFSISFDELLARPLTEADITLTCVSNTVGGKLAGNARWLGVPLRELLDEAGVDPRADQIIGRSVDGFTCGFPVSAAYDRTALVAIAMNGEPLLAEHGFPARLITAGLYGYVSATKWLTEIELSRFDEFDQYWAQRGWDAEAPIKTMTRIDTPKSLAGLPAGTVAIGGVAWAQTRGIATVEVQIDDGEWQPAELADALNDDTWRQWMLAWDATPGRHRITARATDGSGELQTDTRAEPFPNGASGWHNLIVTVS